MSDNLNTNEDKSQELRETLREGENSVGKPSSARRRQEARAAGRLFRERIAEADAQYEKEPLLSQTSKGIIGMLISLTFVLLIILFFSRIIFLHEEEGTEKTGTITSTLPTGTTVATTTGLNQRQSKVTKEKIKYNVDSKTATGENGEPAPAAATEKIKCISPVLIHPKPNSSSGDIGTVKLNDEVEFIREENGWYYITYNGITGYAWGQFFEAPKNPQGNQENNQ